MFKDMENPEMTPPSVNLDGIEGCISEHNFKLPKEEKKNSKTETNLESSSQNHTLKRKKFVLGNHIEIIEGNPTIYLCTICKHKFKWKRQCAYHAYCSTGERPLQCNYCPKRFITNSHLQYHLLSHSGEHPYKCTKCDKQYRSKDKLRRHERVHRDHNAERDKCSICQKVLSSAHSLKLHMLVHSSDRPYKCKRCKKGYTNEYDYKRHLMRHTGVRNYVCEHCGKSFPRKFNLNAHYVIHSGIRPFECNQCNITFKKKYELTRHEKQHERNFLYECNLCQTKFSRKDNLLRHARNTHPGDKVTIKLTKNISSDEECGKSDEEDDPRLPVRQSVIVTGPALLAEKQVHQNRPPVIQLAPSFKQY